MKSLHKNPSEGMSLTSGLILGAAALGALFFFTRSSKAESKTPARRGRTPERRRLPNARCLPASEADLEAFGKATGYLVFYDDKSTTLTEPPANPNFINNLNAREYLVNSCSFFMWNGAQWVVDAKTNAEFEAWLKARAEAERVGPIYAPLPPGISGPLGYISYLSKGH